MSMLLRLAFTLDCISLIDLSKLSRWRQMKHARTENSHRVYGNTRMDNIWTFREVYNTAQKRKEKQDTYCLEALNREWTSSATFLRNQNGKRLLISSKYVSR